MKNLTGRSTLIGAAGTLLLLIACASEMHAQVSNPMINYQGRAVDANGAPLTGTRSVQMRIYDGVSGGTVLFTETHPNVLFSNDGIFTIVVGSSTPGGIPQSVGFDQPRWLGVTVSGFNSGNELPRLRFYGTPYTFMANRAFFSDSARRADSARVSGTAARATRATIADSAVVAARATTALKADSALYAEEADFAYSAEFADTADFAYELIAPVDITYDDDDVPAVVITNKTGLGLGVDGGIVAIGVPYAIVNVGVDSTSERFVSGRSVGDANAPVAGSIYRDNAPLAWGRIAADGTILADFGILRVGHTPNAPGVYQIFLDNAVAVDKNGEPAIAPVITPETLTINENLRFASWGTVLGSGGVTSNNEIVVRIRDFESGADGAFTIVIHGRPE